MNSELWGSSVHLSPKGPRRPSAARTLAHALGIGTLVAGGLAIAFWILVALLLIVPVVFWFAWNELGLGAAMGLPELGFWGILLASVFLTLGWFGKAIIVAVVFFLDPAWLSGEKLVHWPEPTLRNFVAVALLAMLAASPHARARETDRRHDRSRR
jgi:hypothetical protein